MERIVIIKHTGDGKYIFRVPDGRTLKAGDMVLCQTRRGIVPGLCCCDSFDTDKVDTIRSAFGAPTDTPLAPIVGEYQYNMWGDQHFDEVVAAELMDFDTVMNRGAV